MPWVSMAGSTGAVIRFMVDSALRSRWAAQVPIGTLTINLSGSLLLGLLTRMVMFHAAPSTLILVAGTGFCGGYTTFSAASFESVWLIQQGQYRPAFVTCGGNLFGTFAAAALGLALSAI